MVEEGKQGVACGLPQIGHPRPRADGKSHNGAQRKSGCHQQAPPGAGRQGQRRTAKSHGKDRRRQLEPHGQPDEKPLVKACSQSDLVLVYAFNHARNIWWAALKNKVSRLDKLKVFGLSHEATQSLVSMAERSMQLQATIQEETLTLSSQLGSIEVDTTLLS